MADGDQRIEVLEDEMKVLKGEVSRTLVDLRALLMREESPLMTGSLLNRVAASRDPAPSVTAQITLAPMSEPAAPNISIVALGAPDQAPSPLAGLPSLGGIEMPDAPGAPDGAAFPSQGGDITVPAASPPPSAPSAGDFSPPAAAPSPDSAPTADSEWEEERDEERARQRKARIQEEDAKEDEQRADRARRREQELEEDRTDRERRNRKRQQENEEDEADQERRERRNHRRQEEDQEEVSEREQGERKARRDQEDEEDRERLERRKQREQEEDEERERISNSRESDDDFESSLDVASGMDASDDDPEDDGHTTVLDASEEDSDHAEDETYEPDDESGDDHDNEPDDESNDESDGESDNESGDGYDNEPDDESGNESGDRSNGLMPSESFGQDSDYGFDYEQQDDEEDEIGDGYTASNENGYADERDEDLGYPPDLGPAMFGEEDNFESHEYQEEPKINGNNSSRRPRRPDDGRRSYEESHYEDPNQEFDREPQSPRQPQRAPRPYPEGRGEPRGRGPAPDNYGYAPNSYPPNAGNGQWGQPPAGYPQWPAPQDRMPEPSPMDLNLVSSLVRWASLAKNRVGEKRLSDIIELYVESRSATPGLKEALTHIASIVDDQPPESGQTAQETMDLIAHLHGILTAALPVPEVPRINSKISFVTGGGGNGNGNGNGDW